MGLAININELINGKIIEWERLEFKLGWNPEPILHTLCAFANDINNWGGGYIIIGIAEKNGRPVLPPVGINPDSIDKLQADITQFGHRISPHYLPIVQPVLFDNKHILVIYAPAGDLRPYTAPESMAKKNVKRFPYIRSGSQSIIAKGESLRRLQELAARIPFDDRINREAQLNDLNLGLIRDFLQEINSDLFEESVTMPFADLCRQMHIARGAIEALQPLNVGLMFFCKEPHRFFPRAWIEVVIRNDEAGKDFTETYFKGPIHIQLRNALSFISTFVILEQVKKIDNKAEANRIYNFPYEAVEEALTNAVYHKSYEIGKPIEVQIWPDKIEILSFPGPVPPITAKILAENRRIVARDYRNRRVGDFLKELHLTEGRGTGIPTIYKMMEQNNSPAPLIQSDEQCTYFLTVLHANEDFKHIDLLSKVRSNQESDQESDQVSDQEIAILNYCTASKSRLEILSYIKLKNHFDNYKRHIEPLLKKDWLERTIPGNPKDRNQKYRTTDTGKKVLKEVSG